VKRLALRSLAALALLSVPAVAVAPSSTFNLIRAVTANVSGLLTTGQLAITGPGSTGPADGFNVTPRGLPPTSARQLSDKLADLPINVNDFKNLVSGTDATAAVQAAVNAGLAQNRPVRCDGNYNVTHIVVSTRYLRLQGTCYLVGTATTATASVLEIQAGAMEIQGSLEVSANYNVNYDTAILWTGSTQYSHIANLSASAAKLCFTLGSPDKPSALMSEITIVGGHTYGCTQVAKVIGIEAVVHIIGAQWSSDAFGAPSQTWAGVPFRGITAVGSDVNMIGGELIMTSVTSGSLIDNQPITGTTEGTYYSRMRFRGVTMETASPLATTSNPSNLTIAPASQQRGVILFDGVNGFHSQNAAPLIQTSADYDGEVIWSNGRMTFPSGTRTQPNIQAASVKTDIYVDDGGFGPGFQGAIAGSVGGNVHFSSRLILSAYNLNSQSIANGNTTLVYKNLDSGKDRARFGSAYSNTTGVFTVPSGGLKELRLDGVLQLGGSGTLYVNRDDGGGLAQVTAYPYANGSAAISYDAVDVPAGSKLSLLVSTPNATTTGGPDYFNMLRIRARN